MSRIRQAFAGHKALIPFITCGDPDLETTEALVLKLAESGADLIELGIPFSDPTAEGPVIMEASERALKAGATTDKIFAMVKRLRTVTDIPLVFMTYANVVYSYGTERFMKQCQEIGIDGLILPDVPYEEKEEFAPCAEQYGVDLISMVAPTSEHRIAMIAKEAKGFLYIVSSLGVTGVRSSISTDIRPMTELIRSVTEIPCAVGFGISSPEQAASMADCSDGAIVGSAIVKLIAQYGKDCIQPVGEFVRSLADSVHAVN
jgi:tryptophan synthase alpha chain